MKKWWWSNENSCVFGGFFYVQVLWIYISIEIFYVVCFVVTVSDIQKVLEVCNICYQTQNATLSSKAIEFYTNVAVAYKKSSEFINWQNIHV